MLSANATQSIMPNSSRGTKRKRDDLYCKDIPAGLEDTTIQVPWDASEPQPKRHRPPPLQIQAHTQGEDVECLAETAGGSVVWGTTVGQGRQHTASSIAVGRDPTDLATRSIFRTTPRPRRRLLLGGSLSCASGHRNPHDVSDEAYHGDDERDDTGDRNSSPPTGRGPLTRHTRPREKPPVNSRGVYDAFCHYCLTDGLGPNHAFEECRRPVAKRLEGAAFVTKPSPLRPTILEFRWTHLREQI